MAAALARRKKPVREGAPPAGPGGIFAVPSRRVVCACFWVAAADSAAVKAAVELELEVRGLMAVSPDFLKLIRTWPEGDRTLVSLPIFGNILPEESGGAVDFEAAPHLLELEPDALSLWPEAGDVVAAFTRGTRVVYWTTFARENLHEELELARLQLEALEMLPPRSGKIVLHPALELLTGELEAGGTRTVMVRSDWLPSRRHAQFGWKPEGVRSAEAKAGRTKKQRSLVLLAAGAYLALVLAAIGYLAWLKSENYFLKREEAVLAEQMVDLRPLVVEWQQIAPSAEPERFPLEILHQVVKSMPAEGIRLTVYDVAAGTISIEGEAASASLASQFYDAITENTELKQVEWEMPPPALQPNSTARFRIKGVVL